MLQTTSYTKLLKTSTFLHSTLYRFQWYTVPQSRVARHIQNKGVIVCPHEWVPAAVQYQLGAHRSHCCRIARQGAEALCKPGVLPLQLLGVQHKQVIQRLQAPLYPARKRPLNSTDSRHRVKSLMSIQAAHQLSNNTDLARSNSSTS